MRDVNTRKNAKSAWTKVREVLHGAGNDNSHQVDGLTAEELNKHYADISTDCDYRAPRSKHTVVGQVSFITEMDTFWILDTLRPTATGLDGIPALFLRIGAPVFAVPLAQLFNQSMVEGAVPSQWRTAVITPIPKVPKPTQAADYRPISITPVLSRSLEKYIVRTFIYPALQLPYPELCFDDQFAFWPTGSTVIALLHTVRTMLSTDQYVHVFSFDFTKAFDTVRHETLMNKMVQLNIPDNIYNWIKAFFEQHFNLQSTKAKVTLWSVDLIEGLNCWNML